MARAGAGSGPPASARQKKLGAMFKRKAKAVATAQAGAAESLRAAKEARYFKAASSMVSMLAERGDESCLGSLDHVMKQLQTQDGFAFAQMMEKVMAGAAKMEHLEGHGAKDAQDKAAADWASVMKWAKKKAMASSEEIPSSNLMLHNAPDVSATRLVRLPNPKPQPAAPCQTLTRAGVWLGRGTWR